MSLTRVKELETFANATYANGAVQAVRMYLQNASGSNEYATMKTLLDNAKNGFSAPGVSGPRILVSLPDGSVVYDSSRANNTVANANAKAINENHNSRLAMIAAMLSQSGVGTETKYSTSTLNTEQALAHRIGKTQQDSVGCIRWTLQG